jgi:hypothetical protein
MKNKLNTHTAIYEIMMPFNPLIDSGLTIADLRLLAKVLLEEAAVWEEEE